MDTPRLSPPTILDLKASWQEDDHGYGYEQVYEETSPDDHGYGYTYVFQRLADATFWETSGVCQGGGDYHQLREGEGDVLQVWPITVTTTQYSHTKPKDL